MAFITYHRLCRALLSVLLMGAISYDAMAASPHVNQAPPTAAIHEVTLDKGVYEVAYSTRLHQLLVAVSGDRAQAEDRGYITVLNPDTLEIQARYPTQARPFGLALDDEQGELYTTNTVDATVSKYDLTHHGQHLGTVRLAEKTSDMARYPYRPREARLDTANHRLYVTGLADNGCLYVIDTQTMTLIHTIEHLGLRPSALAIDTTHRRLFVSNAQGEVIIISMDTLSEETRIPIGGLPLNMIYDSAQQRLYAADYQNHDIKIIDVRPGTPFKVQHQLTTADGPLSLAIDPARHKLHVTERLNGTVSTFDLEHLTLVERVALPPYPNSLAIDNRTGTRFVTIKQERSKDKTKDRAESVGRLP